MNSKSLYITTCAAVVIATAFVVLAVVSCSSDGISNESTNNADIEVTLLFEHEGVKVYRFKDAGRYIYYTDARGKTEWDTTHSTGKSSYTEKHHVETVR